MTTLIELTKALTEMIDELSRPLSAQDLREGWNRELAQAWRQVFNEMLADAQEGTEPRKWFTIVRGLDEDGVGFSRLAKNGLEVQRVCRAIYRS